jgi:hypothetical protein
VTGVWICVEDEADKADTSADLDFLIGASGREIPAASTDLRAPLTVRSAARDRYLICPACFRMRALLDVPHGLRS